MTGVQPARHDCGPGPPVHLEVYALLTYQALRTAVAGATSTQPGLDPDRASFTIALHAARDQVIQATGVIAATATVLTGNIGLLVLAYVMPSRALRVNARSAKRAISKIQCPRARIDRTTSNATIAISILTRPSLTTSDDPELPGISSSPGLSPQGAGRFVQL